jgi:hypothetical protein
MTRINSTLIPSRGERERYSPRNQRIGHRIAVPTLKRYIEDGCGRIALLDERQRLRDVSRGTQGLVTELLKPILHQHREQRLVVDDKNAACSHGYSFFPVKVGRTSRSRTTLAVGGCLACAIMREATRLRLARSNGLRIRVKSEASAAIWL